MSPSGIFHYTPIDNSTIQVTRNCAFCGKEQTLQPVWLEDWSKFVNNEGHVKDIFPYLSVDDHEMLLSGVCSPCWDSTFKTA